MHEYVYLLKYAITKRKSLPLVSKLLQSLLNQAFLYCIRFQTKYCKIIDLPYLFGCIIVLPIFTGIIQICIHAIETQF